MSDLLETSVERVYLKSGETLMLDQPVVSTFINDNVLSGYYVKDDGMTDGTQRVIEMSNIAKRVPLGLNKETGQAEEAPEHWFWQDRRRQNG
jgi:hypothetical protein